MSLKGDVYKMAQQAHCILHRQIKAAIIQGVCVPVNKLKWIFQQYGKECAIRVVLPFLEEMS